MDYQRLYDALISRARTRLLPKGRLEKHHVIPKCVGGLDDQTNIVVLTTKEHFFAHLLLIKLYPGNERVNYAAFRMSNMRKYNTSKKYEQLRINHVNSCKNIGNTHKVNKTGIFADGMQSKGGKISSELSKKRNSAFHNLETKSKAGRIGGKLPWWYNPETKKVTRASKQPEGYLPGRGFLPWMCENGKKMYELKLGCHAPGMALKGGKSKKPRKSKNAT